VQPLPGGREFIERLIPHRDPMLLIDRVLELEPGRRAVAEKMVSADEPWARGHFPERPILPGVLILEGMAQTAGLCAATLPAWKGKLGVLAGADGVRFRRMVLPGETLRFEADVRLLRSRGGRASVRAFVGAELAAEAEIFILLAEERSVPPTGP
jgi:3-hydroxyacyl-[acyl-carrier-protein] dehydratase